MKYIGENLPWLNKYSFTPSKVYFILPCLLYNACHGLSCFA